MWTLVGEPLNGGTFTFLDYEAAVTPARTRQAEDLDQALADVARARSPAPDVVADVQRRLVSALSAWQSRR